MTGLTGVTGAKGVKGDGVTEVTVSYIFFKALDLMCMFFNPLKPMDGRIFTILNVLSEKRGIIHFLRLRHCLSV